MANQSIGKYIKRISNNISAALLLTFTFGIFLASGVFLLLISLPPILPPFDLTKPSIVAIATVISGVSTPIIGVLSSWLIYLALTRQIESNNSQSTKNDMDIIFMMLNQLDIELNGFKSLTTYKTNNVVTDKVDYNGYEALVRFSNTYSGHQKEYLIGSFIADSRSDTFLYLIKSFDIISEKINTSGFSSSNQKLLNDKIHLYYLTKLEVPVKNLASSFVDYKDREIIALITRFYDKNNTGRTIEI